MSTDKERHLDDIINRLSLSTLADVEEVDEELNDDDDDDIVEALNTNPGSQSAGPGSSHGKFGSQSVASSSNSSKLSSELTASSSNHNQAGLSNSSQEPVYSNGPIDKSQTTSKLSPNGGTNGAKDGIAENGGKKGILKVGSGQNGATNLEKNGEESQGYSSGSSESKKILDPLASFKKLLAGRRASSETKPSKSELLKAVKVDDLPQRFVVKYLGAKSCTNLWGSETTRPLIDDLMAALKSRPSGEDLSLLSLKVSQTGFETKLHRRNTASRVPSNLGPTPLEFVSYAAQDSRYSRVAAVIVVKEMSARAKRAECRGYLCDSAVTARRLALSFNLAFATCASKMEGKPYKFGVEFKELETRGDGNGTTGRASVECEA